MNSLKLLIGFVLITCYGCSQNVHDGVVSSDKSTEEITNQVTLLIDSLMDTHNSGYGYSGSFSGSQFILYEESEEIGTVLLGGPAPERSKIIEEIVGYGVDALPALINHLDDNRITQIDTMRPMMWISFDDEYDYNRRTIDTIPAGVNIDAWGISDSAENHPRFHVLTVGDICFVALGQIVNRGFNAVRYQPTGGLVVSSTSSSPQLCSVIKEEWADLTKEEHKRRLIEDFEHPDHEYRRIGAYYRLAYYYPEAVDELVQHQLDVATYDVFKIHDFVREQLYRAKSNTKRKELFDTYVEKNGPAATDGIRVHLFQDLDNQIANEEGRFHPPLKDPYYARELLQLLYDYPDSVKTSDKPYKTYWAETEKERFEEAIKVVKHHSKKK